LRPTVISKRSAEPGGGGFAVAVVTLDGGEKVFVAREVLPLRRGTSCEIAVIVYGFCQRFRGEQQLRS
jgi:hypothetical protein